MGRVLRLNVDDLTVDESYQRVQMMSWVRRIAKDVGFDEKLCGVLEVSRDGDRFHIVDGQQRWLLAKACGVRTLLCNVTTESRREAADRCRMLNTQRSKWSAWDTHHAAVGAGDPLSVAIDETLDRYGRRLVSGGATPLKVRSVAAIRKIATEWGLDVLDATCRVMFDAWPDENIPSPLWGAVAVIIHDAKCDMTRLTRTLSEARPARFVNDARDMTGRSGQPGQRTIANVIIESYNRRLKGAQRLSPVAA